MNRSPKHRPKKYLTRKPTLGSFLKTLPVYEAVKSSVILNQKLLPRLNQHLVSSAQLQAESLITSISLLSTNSGNTLCIDCSNSSVVTQIRHSQTSLLEHVNSCFAGDDELLALLEKTDSKSMPIQSLKIRVAIIKESKTLPNSYEPHSNNQSLDVDPRLSANSSEVVQQLSEHLDDDSDLANSLKKLAQTLKKNAPSE